MECRVSGFANKQRSLALRVVMARASEADVEHIVIVIAIAFAFAIAISFAIVILGLSWAILGPTCVLSHQDCPKSKNNCSLILTRSWAYLGYSLIVRPTKKEL